MTDRRQVLRAGVVAVVGVSILPGCSEDAPLSEPPAVPDLQQADELALIEAYDAALATAGARAVALYTQLRDEHLAHLTALGWQATPQPSASPMNVTRADLLRAERRATRTRTQGARDTDDVEQAQLLALIAASEAQHVRRLESL